MKNSVSSVWLVGIVIAFILLFSAYIAITVDYSRTFKLKNEVLTIIQKNKGMTNDPGSEKDRAGKISCANNVGPCPRLKVGVGALQTINLYLKGNSYNSKGYCPTDGAKWYGVDNLNHETIVSAHYADPDTKYYYCFSKYKVGSNDIKASSNSIFYKVRLFYKMDFPVIQEFMQVKVEGITDEIYNPVNDGVDSSGYLYD